MARKVKRSDVSKKIWGLQVNPPVFFISTLIIVLSVALTLIFHDQAKETFVNLQEVVAEGADWFFILSINLFLIFLFYLALGKFGKLRIGGPKARPEFKTTSWFAMLFSAGMGIGLLFFGVGEPIKHFSNPPTAIAGKAEAANQAMDFTFLHYGLPLTIRSIFYPLLGDRIYGRIGDAIDILAVLATVFGLATSLGFGVQQIATGLNFVFGFSSGVGMQVFYIAIITFIATGSVVLGVDKGVKILSEWNMRIALILLLLAVILGPTLFIFRSFVENTGSYIAHFVEMASWSETYTGGKWQNDWTVFYWGWWIGWSPFVGMFIARISKGRTIREFILGVLLVPSLLTFFWMSAFGSAAIQQAMTEGSVIVEAVNDDMATALFVFFQDYPLASVINIIAVILVAGFFITSSDSGSLVIDSITSGGKTDSPVGQRIFWAFTEGTIAAVLLIGGGLQALQSAALVTGLPFAAILLLMCYSLYKGLKEDFAQLKKQESEKERDTYETIVSDIVQKRSVKLDKDKLEKE